MNLENSTTSTIAIVDDDVTFRFIFSKQLLEIDHSSKILEFADGFDILEFLLENKENPDALPDTIFLDLNMKQIDGWVFLEEFENAKKYIPKHITIHIITGSNEAEDRLKAQKCQLVADFISKPIETEQLRVSLALN